MLYRIMLEVYAEADSFTEASNAASLPLTKEIADRLRRAGMGTDSAHVTRCEVKQATAL